jgi:hypothetical protein
MVQVARPCFTSPNTVRTNSLILCDKLILNVKKCSFKSTITYQTSKALEGSCPFLCDILPADTYSHNESMQNYPIRNDLFFVFVFVSSLKCIFCNLPPLGGLCW